LASLGLEARGYSWTVQLAARALLRRDLVVAEEAVGFRRRRGGRSKVAGRLWPSLRAGAAMIAMAFHERPQRGLLVLMAKAPGAGRAKTRLAADLGPEAAAEFWRACLADVAGGLRLAAGRAGLELAVMLSGRDDVEEVEKLVGPGWQALVQKRPGLGMALLETFLLAREQGASVALAVSGDNPSLPPERLVEAAAAVRERGAVLGPCPDGGYYLVGLRLDRPGLARRLRACFAEVEPDGGDVLERTRAALAANGWQPQLLEPWSDVDTVEDLGRLAEELAADPGRAPLTAGWLAGRLVRIHRA
jgi:glycosyltransferase A (GT-A) superfamily protein (DUF2064 family)